MNTKYLVPSTGKYEYEVLVHNKNAFQWDAYHPLIDRISS